MGGWFTWVVFGAIAVEFILYMVILSKQKKRIRLRAMGENAEREDGEEKSIGDTFRAPEEKTSGDIFDGYGREKKDDM